MVYSVTCCGSRGHRRYWGWRREATPVARSQVGRPDRDRHGLVRQVDNAQVVIAGHRERAACEAAVKPRYEDQQVPSGGDIDTAQDAVCRTGSERPG